MIRSVDIDECVATEFGSRLEPQGFRRLGRRQWVRPAALPVRHLFAIRALKGAAYSPVWGVSSGVVPIIRGSRFRRQLSERNAVMDLIIDPIDVSGVPEEVFAFELGPTTILPRGEIGRCAEHSVPVALNDFGQAQSLDAFCRFFLERSRLSYARLGFDSYIRHRISRGFVSLLQGNEAEGLRIIQDFCERQGLDVHDLVLQECVDLARQEA